MGYCGYKIKLRSEKGYLDWIIWRFLLIGVKRCNERGWYEIMVDLGINGRWENGDDMDKFFLKFVYREKSWSNIWS